MKPMLMFVTLGIIGVVTWAGLALIKRLVKYREDSRDFDRRGEAMLAFEKALAEKAMKGQEAERVESAKLSPTSPAEGTRSGEEKELT